MAKRALVAAQGGRCVTREKHRRRAVVRFWANLLVLRRHSVWFVEAPTARAGVGSHCRGETPHHPPSLLGTSIVHTWLVAERAVYHARGDGRAPGRASARGKRIAI